MFAWQFPLCHYVTSVNQTLQQCTSFYFLFFYFSRKIMVQGISFKSYIHVVMYIIVFFLILIIQLEDRITLDHLNKMRQAFEVRSTLICESLSNQIPAYNIHVMQIKFQTIYPVKVQLPFFLCHQKYPIHCIVTCSGYIFSQSYM